MQPKQSSDSMHRAERGGHSDNTGSRASSKTAQDGFLSIGGWQQRLRLSKEKREDQRREKDRARLRKSIGARIVVPDARVV